MKSLFKSKAGQYEQWEKLRCRVVRTIEHRRSYEVVIIKDNVTAGVVCVEDLRAGEEFVALFASSSPNNGPPLLVTHGPETLLRRKKRICVETLEKSINAHIRDDGGYIEQNFKTLVEVMKLRIWSGFYLPDQISEAVTNVLGNDYCSSLISELDKSAISNIAQELFEQKLEEEKSWSQTTSCDKLDQAFQKLIKLGILSLQNEGYTNSEAWREYERVLWFGDFGENRKNIRGGCFISSESVDWALNTDKLLVCASLLPNGKGNLLDLKSDIVKNLGECGLSAKWNGKEDGTIVLPMKWQRRSLQK